MPMDQNDIDVNAVLARLDERTGTIVDQVERITHVLLEGNGTPPITVTVARLDERLKDLEQKDLENRVPRPVWIGIVVSIVMGLIAIVVTLKG